MNIYGRFVGTFVMVLGLALIVGLIWIYIVVGNVVRLVKP